MQDADDPGRPFVRRRGQPEPRDQRRIGAQTGDRNGARVGDVGEERTERHDELRAERLGELDHQLAERPPAKRRLGAGQQDQVAVGAGNVGLVELDGRPHDLARLSVDELDARARGLEVIELLRVDRREPLRVERRADELNRARGGIGGVVPSLERADQRRVAKPVRTVLPLEWLHPTHRT